MPLLSPPSLTDCLPNSRLSFIGNISGRKVEVFVGADGGLWYHNTYRDAEDFDEPPGQHVVASRVQDCIRWIKSHTVAGPGRDRILEHYEWFSFQYFQEQQQKRIEESVAKFDEWQKQLVIGYWDYLERQAAAEFPVESQEVSNADRMEPMD